MLHIVILHNENKPFYNMCEFTKYSVYLLLIFIFLSFVSALQMIVSCHVSQAQPHAFLPKVIFELWLLPNLTFRVIQLSQFSYSYPGPQFLIQTHGDSQEKKKKPFLSDIHLPERVVTYLLCSHGLIQFQNIHIHIHIHIHPPLPAIFVIC